MSRSSKTVVAKKRKPTWKQRIWRWLRWFLAFLAGLILVIALALLWVCYRFDQQHKGQPYELGVTFSEKYAQQLGLNWQETYLALLDQLHVKRFRLMSYWDVGEPQPGVYDFKDLDWQIQQADMRGVKVSLAVGLRQPRYPECFAPDWAQKLSQTQRQQALDQYLAVVIDRYKNNPAITDYELENEALLGVFGVCQPYHINRPQLQAELNIVHQQDPHHPVTMSVSNEFGLPLGQPRPDQSAFSIYRIVWDRNVTHTYFHYPFPTWWFKARAGMIEQWLGMPVYVHELQAEPWGPEGTQSLSLAEQDKSMNAQQLVKNIDYVKATGIREMYLWGGEWWYWRMVKFNDPSLWNAAKIEFAQNPN